MKMLKKNKKAAKLEAMGHELFESGNFFEALLAYNQSLLYAETGTVDVAKGYANRSKVYFALKEFELCLQNISLAKASGYPNEQIQMLSEMEENCEKLLLQQDRSLEENAKALLKLSFPPNPKLPCLASCLELRQNQKFGKYIITNQDLKAGDVIAITKPSFIFFDKRGRLHHCSHCAENSMNLSLIPCTGCTKAMYCSEECLTADREKFHQFECGFEENPDEAFTEYIALKMLCQTLYHFDWNIDELRIFLEANRKSQTVFDFDLSDVNDPMHYKNILLATLTHKGIFEKSSPEVDDQEKFFYKDFIKRHPKLNALTSSYRNKKFLFELLPKLHKASVRRQYFYITSDIDMNVKTPHEEDQMIKEHHLDGTFTQAYGNQTHSMVDPYTKLLGPSCVKSVVVRNFDGKTIWVVVRPVSAGEGIFRTIGLDLVQDVYERQCYFKYCLDYKCTCEACDKVWPTINKMKTIRAEDIDDATKENSSRLLLLDKNDHINRYKVLTSLANSFARSLPNQCYFYALEKFSNELRALTRPRLYALPK